MILLLAPLALFSLLRCGDAGTILVYSPSISASHLIMNYRIAETLTNAGHKVVVFVPEYFPGLREFRISPNSNATYLYMNDIDNAYLDYISQEDDLFGHDCTPISARLGFEDANHAMCRGILRRFDELKKLLAPYKFDVAFSEQLDACGNGMLKYLGIENQIWISTTALMEANSYRLGVPQPSSYVPTIEENDNSDVLSFWDRAYNLWMYVLAIAIHSYGADGTTKIFRELARPDFPHMGEIMANSSLCFINSDEQFDLPRPSIWKNIYVGGLGINEPKPLDEKYTKLISKGKKGVILFSLGTIAPFHVLPAKTQEDIKQVFNRFKDYHFILKIAKEDTTTKDKLTGVDNVDMVTWMPQSDLLGHPRLKLFVMHGGLNGLLETAYRAVPVIVIPFFADQFRNGRLAEKRGTGKVLLRRDVTAERLGKLVQEILTHSSYKNAANKVAKLLKTRPFSPEERLVKWTEFAMENGVLSHLNVEGASMNTIVYFNLDVIAALILGVIIVVYLAFKLLSLILRTMISKKNSLKAKRQ